MFFGLLFIIVGVFLVLWGAHYFGVLAVVGTNDANTNKGTANG